MAIRGEPLVSGLGLESDSQHLPHGDPVQTLGGPGALQNTTLLEALLFHGCATSPQFLSLSELHFLHLQSRVSDTVLTSVRPASVWSLNVSTSPWGAGGCWWLLASSLPHPGRLSPGFSTWSLWVRMAAPSSRMNVESQTA